MTPPQDTREPGRTSGFLALLRNRNYALLITSQGISQLGDRFHWVAISLWVYSVTGSALSVSYAIMALLVGPSVVGLFAGVLVDRWDRRRTMIAADLVRAGLVALIPTLMAIDIRLVYFDLFLVSAASTFFRPSVLAAMQATIPRADLMPANSFFTSVETATEIVGPIFAGILIQISGYGLALYIDAVSYLASAALILFVALPRLQGPARVGGSGFVPEVKEGFQHIRRSRVQLGLLVLIFAGWWLSGINSLQTPLAKGVLGLSDRQYGWVNSGWGVGFLVGSLLLGWYGSRSVRGRLIAWGFGGWILATALAGVSTNGGMLFVTLFWVAISNIVLFVSLATTLLEITPPHMLGRVLATRQVALAVVRVAAMFGFGVVADALGVRQAFLGMAIVAAVGLAGTLAFFPEILRLGRRHDMVKAPSEARLASATAPESAEQLLLREGDKDVGARVRDGVGSVVPWARFRRWIMTTLVGATDPTYDAESQRVASRAVLIIGLVSLIGLLLTNYRLAIFIALTLGSAALIKPLRRFMKRQLGSMKVLPSWHLWARRGSRDRGESVRKPDRRVVARGTPSR